MRADRLLSMLMLLQTHGRLTAAFLAEELEVSERTIYRDITALSTAGVPVYTEKGPGGGIALVENYRTNLTGLTLEEVRALFMLSVPAALDELGMGQTLKAALLKLSAALPTHSQQAELSTHPRIHIDSQWWFAEHSALPVLETLQQAIWAARQVEVRYRKFPAIQVEMQIDPYGLVSKAGVWYLVWGRGEKVDVYRVSELLDVCILDAAFERPVDFNLGGFWAQWRNAYLIQRQQYRVVVHAKGDINRSLPNLFDAQTELLSQEADDKGIWALHFGSLEMAREALLPLGASVEVLEPDVLRLTIHDFAKQIVGVYENK